MKQTRLMSILETALSTAIGFAVALATQLLVFPRFGFHPAITDNLAITLIFTVVSVARQYVMRRVFEALHIRKPMSAFMQAVLHERFAHVDREGFDAAHDDAHAPGELARAGASYAIHAGCKATGLLPVYWPWSAEWWKPADFRRDLVKAAALIIAEGDKFERNRKDKRRAF
ncbi:MAG TPA: hypothetical protein VEU47_11120 [Candidatus Cybelea sp.]|nr:hypothetical protein [Candidatus Cybelea sp.]